MAADNLAALPVAAVKRNRAGALTLPLSAAAPLRLDHGEVGWLVHRGPVDLFAVALAEGEPSGMRHPLCSIAAGELILALPETPTQAVLAVGHLDTAVVPLSRADLAVWPLQRQAELIDLWISRLTGALFADAGGARDHLAELGIPVELGAGQRLTAPRGVVWLSPRRGQLHLGDKPAWRSGAVPITAGLSAQADDDTVVDCLATADAIEGGLGAAGLAVFHEVVLDAIRGKIARAEAAGQQRIVARAAVDRRSMQGAVRQLAGLAAAIPALPEGIVGDPTLAAFAAVAAHQGTVLSRTPRVAETGEAAFRAVARANGVGLRQVLLRADWWRRDNGALLAWSGEARHPIALLPAGRGALRCWDAADGSSMIVDEATAADIAPQALMLYRPMPEAVKGVAGLAGFAGRGIGRELITILAMGLLSGLAAALLPVAIGYLFGSAVARAETGQVVAVILGLVLAALGGGVFDLTKAVALLRLEGRLEAALQPALMHRMLGLPVNFFRGYGTGELTNRVLSIQSMRRLLAGNTLVSLLSGLFAMSSFAVILACSAVLAALAAALVGVAAIVVTALAIGELRQERARIVLRGQEDGLLVQILQGIVKLRVAAGEVRIFAVWAGLFARQKRRFLVGRRYAAASEVFIEVYPILALLALFFVASRMLMPGKSGETALSLGVFLAVNAAFGQLLAATMALARAFASALDLVPLFERLRPLLDAPLEARADKSEAPLLSGRIELRHVSFRYVEGTRPVLDDFSLVIEPGSLIAFVGSSGSGKSTLFRLLLGFETAEAGDILYDGQSIRTLDTASLRRQIGVVLQHSRVTTGSIFEIITSGLPYTLDDAWAAARLAGIDADIEAMAMGMHTLLLEGSSTLSGGQRQRLMIARALIGRPRILLFDEATSALDNRSQALVMRSLERLSTTRVVIAHRLSTVERADRIVVLDGGQVVEAGNYGELVAADGPFSRLARRQIL